MSSDYLPEQRATLQPAPTRSLSERMNYPSFTGIIVATVLIAVPFVGFFALVVDVVMVLRYVFGYRAPGSAQWSVHHPSVTSLVVVWVVAVFTVIAYPLAFYMTWRFFVERQDRIRAGSKVCPRCAETVKAGALVCRHCGQEFDMSASQSAATTIAEPPLGSRASDLATNRQQPGPSRPYRRGVAYLLIGLAAVAIASLLALTFLGSQVRTVLQSESVPLCVIVGDGPLGRLEMYIPGATVAQCEAELASGREAFGPDSSASKLYIVHVLPSGTPACVLGIAQVFTYGLTADTLASQVCP